MIDSVITTGKSILVQKNKAIASSCLVAISQLLFYFVISEIVNADSYVLMIATSLSAGIGAFIAFGINNKFSKEVLYLNIITSDSKENMKSLCDYLRENKIKNIITNSYTKDWDETLLVMILANTRLESKKIDEFLKNTSEKYLREII